jgi:hypothetical protein
MNYDHQIWASDKIQKIPDASEYTGTDPYVLSLQRAVLRSRAKAAAEEEARNVELGIDPTNVDIVILNGGTYCRSHLRVQCHICDVDYEHLMFRANQFRLKQGKRPVGDEHLNFISARFRRERDVHLSYFQDKMLKSADRDG